MVHRPTKADCVSFYGRSVTYHDLQMLVGIDLPEVHAPLRKV